MLRYPSATCDHCEKEYTFEVTVCVGHAYYDTLTCPNCGRDIGRVRSDAGGPYLRQVRDAKTGEILEGEDFDPWTPS